MKLLAVCFFFVMVGTLNSETEQPPYEIADPAISENFREIYRTMDQHKHDNDGSSRLQDLVPASSSTYTLGTSSTPWEAVYTDNVFIRGTSISTNTNIMHAGGFNSTLGTGTTFSAFVPDSPITLRRITSTIVVAGIAGNGDQWICGDGVNKISVITEAAAAAGVTRSSATMAANIAAGSTVYFRLNSDAATTPTANILVGYTIR